MISVELCSTSCAQLEGSTYVRNRLYAGIVDVPEYGVRAKRGDFEPLI